VVRKTILRLAGCIMGGLAALAAMIIVSQNFDSLPPYLVAIFAVTMFSTYISQSSEWLGYAGIQTGMTFLICYVGLAPSSDVYKPLWRFWGIVLGVLTTGFVYLFLWPEYASDKMMASLIELTGNTLGFAREVAEQRITEGRITAAERRLSLNLLQLLNMADQARLEGHRGSANSAAAVEAAAILIRIAYRFQTIARQRLVGSELTLPQNVREGYTIQEQKYCFELELELQKLKAAGLSRQSAPIAPTSPRTEPMPRDRGVTSEPATGTDLFEYFHTNLVPQIESYRRLPVLLRQLDTVLSKMGAGAQRSRKYP
jgi:uncharacterized membrane protein YccC